MVGGALFFHDRERLLMKHGRTINKEIFVQTKKLATLVFWEFIVAFIITGLAMPALAFKVSTHVWIGQQVINDLEDDGQLSIELDGKTIYLPVDPVTKTAILNHKSDFLMGNIGPDAAPDVVVGQSLVHPGTEGGWKTNDWLEYLLEGADDSDLGKAFTYGYLGHAASDVFAHTYVNQYAGDIFELTDNETLVEKRHFVLEGYIDEHTPPLQDYQGNLLGKPQDLINLDDDYGTYVRDTLVFNGTVAQEYWKNPLGRHLAAYYEYREAIDSLAEDGIWRDIDIAVLQIVARYFNIEITPDEASKIVDAAQPVLDAFNNDIPDEVQALENRLFEYALKYEALGFEQVSAAVDRMQRAEERLFSKKQNIENEMATLNSRLRNQACGVTSEALQRLGSSLDFLNDVVDPLGTLDPLGVRSRLIEGISNGDIEAILDPLDFFGGQDDDVTYVISFTLTGIAGELALSNERTANLFRMRAASEERFGNANFGGAIWLAETKAAIANMYPADEYISIEVNHYYGAVDGSTVANQVSDFEIFCNSVNDLIDRGVSDHIDAIHRLENEILEEKAELIQAIKDLRDETVAAAEAANVIKNALIDLSQIPGSDTSPIQSVLRNWRGDVDVAMREYVKATGQAMLNTMDPDASAISPVINWFDCYHLSIISPGIQGIPNEVSGCEFRDSIATLIDSLTSIISIVGVAGTPPGVDDALERLQELKDEVITELTDSLKEEAADQLEDFIPEEVQELISLFDVPVTDAVLNQYFTTAETAQQPKHLLMIPDMASRVKAEMHLVNGKFDPNEFAVVRNAIVLAKLALLDYQGLRDLADAAGIPHHFFDGIDNVVANAFETIDANHQWMPESPPLPNSVGAPYFPEGLSFDTDTGFLPWQKPVRNKLFRALFTGPLSAGVDAPEIIGKTRIVKADYPYQPCAIVPYPDDINDRTCIISWLIPVITNGLD
jgi:hypothetical protein